MIRNDEFYKKVFTTALTKGEEGLEEIYQDRDEYKPDPSCKCLVCKREEYCGACEDFGCQV